MKRILAGALLAAAIVRPSFAIDKNAGTTATNILTLQEGARPAGMGGAYVAVSDDINAMYHNISGLGFLKASEFSATQFGGYDSFKLSDLALAIPLGDVTASNVHSLGTILLDFANLDYGTGDGFDATGNSIGELKAKDHVYALGFGKAFADRFAIGALARVYQLQIFGVHANGTSVDLGGLYKVIPGYLNIGVAAKNLTSNIQYAGKTENSPTEVMGGAALTPLGDKVTFALDAGQAADRSGIVRGGVEWHLASAFALRAGYDSSFDAGNGFSFGAGIQLLDLEVGFIPIDRIGLDYSFTPTDNLQEIHRISLTARIGTQ